MIKEYNFPNIFQNVIGNVIPGSLLERRDHSFLYPKSNPSEDHLSIVTSESADLANNSNLFWVQSKRKKLVRRVNCTKTMNPVTYRTPKNKENLLAPQENKYRDYLRKKTLYETENQNKQKTQQKIRYNSEAVDSVSQRQGESQTNLVFDSMGNLKRKRKQLFKMRTSVDNPLLQDQILQNEDQLRWGHKNSDSSQGDQIQKQIKINIDDESQTNSEQSSSEYINENGQIVRRKHKKRTLKSSGEQQSSQRINSKKKTVFFAAGTTSPLVRSNLNNSGNIFTRKPTDRQGTMYSKFSASKNTRKSKKSKGENQDEAYSAKGSKWSSKSVVSLQFNENNSIYDRSKKSGKSAKSRDSSLISELNSFKRKQTRAKTVKFGFDFQRAPSKKSFKSLRSLNDETSIASKVYISHKRIVSKKSLNSQKQIAESKKKLMKTTKKAPKISILKKEELYLQDDNRSSLRSLYTLRDTARRNDHLKSLKYRARKSIEESNNVYNELNNFIRYFQEHAEIVCEQQIKKIFSKPLVISDQTSKIQKNYNRQTFENDNMCIDMGMKLTKKMNRLRQKKC